MRYRLFVFFMVLIISIGCGPDNDTTIIEVTLPDLVLDRVDNQRKYENRIVQIPGKAVFNLTGIDCDGFCVENPESTDLSHFLFVNEYSPYDNNVCGTTYRHLEYDNLWIKLLGFNDFEGFDFCWLETPNDVKLTGRVIYDEVVDYCESTIKPSLYLELTEESIDLLRKTLSCKL